MRPTLLLVDDDDLYWELVQLVFARSGRDERVELERLDRGEVMTFERLAAFWFDTASLPPRPVQSAR